MHFVIITVNFKNSIKIIVIMMFMIIAIIMPIRVVLQEIKAELLFKVKFVVIKVLLLLDLAITIMITKFVKEIIIISLILPNYYYLKNKIIKLLI